MPVIYKLSQVRDVIFSYYKNKDWKTVSLEHQRRKVLAWTNIRWKYPEQKSMNWFLLGHTLWFPPFLGSAQSLHVQRDQRIFRWWKSCCVLLIPPSHMYSSQGARRTHFKINLKSRATFIERIRTRNLQQLWGQGGWSKGTAWTIEDIEEVTQKDFKPCNTPLIKWKDPTDHVISHFLILPEVFIKDITRSLGGLAGYCFGKTWWWFESLLLTLSAPQAGPGF